MYHLLIRLWCQLDKLRYIHYDSVPARSCDGEVVQGRVGLAFVVVFELKLLSCHYVNVKGTRVDLILTFAKGVGVLYSTDDAVLPERPGYELAKYGVVGYRCPSRSTTTQRVDVGGFL